MTSIELELNVNASGTRTNFKLSKRRSHKIDKVHSPPPWSVWTYHNFREILNYLQ